MRLSTMQYTCNGGSLLARALKQTPWSKCPTCEKSYHKAVRGALGWACFKTYSSCAPTGNRFSGDREFALRLLARSLEDAGQYQSAARVNAVRLREMEYLFPDKLREISAIWSDIARVLLAAGDREDELGARRQAYKKTLEWNEDEFADEEVVWRGSALAVALLADDERTDARVREARE